MAERVEGDVDPLQTGLDERPGEPVEQDAVGRQREILDPGRHRQLAHELRQVTADQRLAAGQPRLAHAHRGEDAHEPRDLLEREHLRARQPLQALRRHAVGAAEIALVGDGDADALDPAPPRVDERLHGNSLSRGDLDRLARSRRAVRFATRQIPAAGPSFTPERLATPSFPIGPDWQSPRRETSARRICGERRADARDRTAP